VTPKLRRACAALFLTVVLGAAGWLGAQVMRPGALAVGAAMPSLRYTGTAGAQPLRAAAEGRTVVVLYNSKCGHCHYELGVLDRNAGRLAGAHLVLVTTEDSVARAEVRREWPRLAASPNVDWGTVSRDEFLRGFGTLATPPSSSSSPTAPCTPASWAKPGSRISCGRSTDKEQARTRPRLTRTPRRNHAPRTGRVLPWSGAPENPPAPTHGEIMTNLNNTQMSAIEGGSLNCFLSGVVVVLGVATLQPEAVAIGLFVASQEC
jgi:hypothetical protein